MEFHVTPGTAGPQTGRTVPPGPPCNETGAERRSSQDRSDLIPSKTSNLVFHLFTPQSIPGKTNDIACLVSTSPPILAPLESTLVKFSKLLSLTALVALIAFISWRTGDQRGYRRGSAEKGAESQIILDANVYWAHRDALYRMSQNDRKLAMREQLVQLEGSRQKVLDSKGSAAASSVESNFIERVERGHAEHLKFFSAGLD